MVVDGAWFGWHTPFASHVSGLSHTPELGSPHGSPGVGMCTTWIFSQVPPLQSRFDKHVTVGSFEQVPWHRSTVQGLSSGKAIQAPGSRPQLHFDGDPACTSAAEVQTVLAPGWFQVSQWSMSTLPSLSASLPHEIVIPNPTQVLPAPQSASDTQIRFELFEHAPAPSGDVASCTRGLCPALMSPHRSPSILT